MPRPRKPYPARIMRNVFRGLKNKINHASDPASIKKLRKALETAREKRALPSIEYKKLKEELEQKAKAVEKVKVKHAKMPGVFGPTLDEVKRLLDAYIKKTPRLSQLEAWNAYQEAYKAYLRGTEFEPLFLAFNNAAENKLKKIRRSRMKTWGVERAIKNKYAWHTFHIHMRDFIKGFGYENIVSLGKMFERASKAGIKILDFYPREKWVLLNVEIPIEGKRIKDIVAIESMKGGKIEKLGSAVKYMVSEKVLEEHFKGGRWFEEVREPELVERYESIRTSLNKLLE